MSTAPSVSTPAASSSFIPLQPSLPSSGLHLESSWNPSMNGHFVIVPTATSSSTTQRSSAHKNEQQLLYYANQASNNIDTVVMERPFIVETWTLFASLQKIAAQNATPSHPDEFSLSTPTTSSPETIQYYNRISRLYRQAIVQQITSIQSTSPSSSRQLTHYASLHSVLSITELLYFPSDGHGSGLIAEELLDWLNTFDPQPTSSQGQELIDLSTPWEHDHFWDYLYKSLLRAHLRSVTSLFGLVELKHTSPWVREIAKIIRELVDDFPRSTAYKHESEFLTASRKWKITVAKAFKKHQQLFTSSAASDSVLGGNDNLDLREDWFAGFNVVFQLLNGRETTLLDCCDDWREALSCWGIWIDPSLTRDRLPSTLALIKKHHPIDETLIEDSIQANLFQGEVIKALTKTSTLSTWLTAHLSDLLDKIAVVDQDADDRSKYPIRLRDWFVMNYAEGLITTDSGLWRVVVEYLATCREEGRARMKAVLKGVDLTLPSVSKEADPTVAQDGIEEKLPLVEEVLSVCAEHGLEDEIISICKSYSEHLVSLQSYGPALSFCIRSGDLKRISRIADRILDEYLLNGQEAFIKHVDSIPTSLLRPHRSPFFPSTNEDEMDDDDTVADMPLSPFSTRLAFLARYRDFFALYALGQKRQAANLLILLLTSNIAPKGFWAVLLFDSVPLLLAEEEGVPLIGQEETFELLRCLEEIVAPIVSPSSSNHQLENEGKQVEDIYGHLTALTKLMNGGNESLENEISKRSVTRKGLKQLDVVREALARNLARCCAL